MVIIISSLRYLPVGTIYEYSITSLKLISIFIYILIRIHTVINTGPSEITTKLANLSLSKSREEFQIPYITIIREVG